MSDQTGGYQPENPESPQGGQPTPPGGNPPPGQPGYGAPGSTGLSLSFDPTAFTVPAIAVLGILAFVFSFLPWYSLPAALNALGAAEQDLNAWDSGFAWAGPMILFPLGLLYLAAMLSLVPRRPLAMAALPAVIYADIFYIVALARTPSILGLEGFSLDRSWALWVSLAIWLLITAAIVLEFLGNHGGAQLMSRIRAQRPVYGQPGWNQQQGWNQPPAGPPPGSGPPPPQA